MLSILVVDDSRSKVKKVSKILEQYEEIPASSILIVEDVLSAKRVLKEKQIDLMILDIQLPMRVGEDPILDAGIDLLREIHDRSVYIKPICIIGLTQYETSLRDVQALFEDMLWNLVLYEESSDKWCCRIKCKINYLIEMKRIGVEKTEYKNELGIVVALNTPEFTHVLRRFSLAEKPILGDSTEYFHGELSKSSGTLRVVGACAPQVGMTATAVLSTKIGFHFTPKYLAMVGIMAGIRNEVEIGDVLIADPSWDWGTGKCRSNGSNSDFQPEPLQERLHPRIRALFYDVQRDEAMLASIWSSYEGNKPSKPPRLHIGPCVSGASVLADSQIVASIKAQNRKLLGIEMESYGLMHSANNLIDPKPYSFSIKVVCDYADEDKNDCMQEYAAYVSAYLLYKIASKYF